MTPPDDRDPVDVLAEEFADRLRRGEHPSVGDYAAAHPDHAEQLRELLPAVAQMEILKRFRRPGGAGKEAMPDRFGDFRIVRELGRGGMGVVFEAVQESLGRPVALKVLSAHTHADRVGRERFVREAQAAARLHHTNIVPVFGVGEQDGLPYYVMQLIPGRGLQDVARGWRHLHESGVGSRETGGRQGTLKETETDATAVPSPTPDPRFPTPDSRVPTPGDGPAYGDWQFVAEIGAQAADALHYAHRQGVLHRDVKPANLLLDPAGRVWVADFGLAKLVEQEGLTASGDILGTLQYLPPECLTGDADARSDVYGLGATLYELLTLRPPYATDNPARLLKQVADTDPVHPRQINPDIPRDLETIVLKAMARDPGRRYTTAREMARDLQAFLEDRPIKARRQTALGRGWRWCRRNPAVAILTANMVAALVLAGVVGWVGYARTTKALQAEAAQLAEAERAKTEAEKARTEAVQASVKLDANLQMSLEAFGQVFDAVRGQQTFFGRGFGPGGPRGGPGGIGFGMGFPTPPARPGEDQQADVLEPILAFYDRFAEQNATNPRLQLEAGRAHRRVGEVHAMRGHAEKAAVSLRRAADLLEGYRRAFPGDRAARAELVQVYLAASPDVFPDYERLLAWSLETTRELAGEIPRPHAAAAVALKLGWVRERNGDRPGAERLYREALAEFETPPDRHDGPPFVPGELVLGRSLLAALLANTNRPQEARKLLEASVAELRSRGDRGWPGGRGPGGLGGFPPELLVPTYRLLATVCDQLGDKQAADAHRAEAERLSQMGPFGKGPNPPRKKE